MCKLEVRTELLKVAIGKQATRVVLMRQQATMLVVPFLWLWPRILV